MMRSIRISLWNQDGSSGEYTILFLYYIQAVYFKVIHWRGDMDIAPLFCISLTTLSFSPLVKSYKVNTDGCVKDGFASGGGLLGIHQVSVFAPSSLHMASALFWRSSSWLFLTISFLLRGLCSQIYVLSPILLWPFTASPKVGDLGLFMPLFATLDISFPSTVILFLIFIARVIRWLTYLLQRIGIVVSILITTLRTYRDVTVT
ncbi:Uncharacterized protein Adt_34299 [Abeliophyllum distichum]|uniref:Uncharacterized protein n=1 Tax=Abeliophyllum distichum TaxID=126358 RepID=A0ABD1QYT7_9LAMI